MDKFPEWLHTGESENGMLEVWCKIDTIDDVKYLKVQYRESSGNIIASFDHQVDHVKLLNGLIDCYRMEYGWDI